MKLYELCGKRTDLAFSPYCWRIKMALKHKGLDFDTHASKFTDKSAFAPSGSETVPVIQDGETWVSDSWDIAVYLDEKYPNKPLFSCDQSKAQAHFINTWSVLSVLLPIFKMLVADIYDLVDPDDKKYFRETREPRLGMTIEETRDHRDKVLGLLHKNLRPLELTLAKQSFLSGDTPAYADYAIFGAFQWARQVSTFEIVPTDSPITAWRDRMLDLFDGYARSAPTV